MKFLKINHENEEWQWQKCDKMKDDKCRKKILLNGIGIEIKCFKNLYLKKYTFLKGNIESFKWQWQKVWQHGTYKKLKEIFGLQMNDDNDKSVTKWQLHLWWMNKVIIRKYLWNIKMFKLWFCVLILCCL